MKRAVRTVYTLFYLSVAASIWAIAAYMLFPIESGAIVDIRNNNLFIGLGIALALLAIGIGAIHWSQGDHVRQGVHRAAPRDAWPRRDARRRRRGVRRRERGVRLRPPRHDPQLADRARRRLARSRPSCSSAASRPQDENPVELLEPHDVEEGHAPGARPRGHADPRRRRHARLRRPRHPRGAGRSSATPTATSSRRPRRSCCSCACSPRDLNETPEQRRTGRTTASSRTPRSAPTSAAPSPCTSSRRTTCCARATSRSSTWPTAPRSSSARPRVRCRSCRSRRRRGLPRRAERLHRTRRPELLGASLSTATGTATETPRRRRRATEAPRRPLHRRDRELHRRAHQPLRRRQGARPQDLPRPLVVHARRDRALELRRRPALGHVPDVLLPGVDGPDALHGRVPPDARASRCRRRCDSTLRHLVRHARRPARAPDPPLGRAACSSPASACTCCASSSPVRSASRASSTG